MNKRIIVVWYVRKKCFIVCFINNYFSLFFICKLVVLGVLGDIMFLWIFLVFMYVLYVLFLYVYVYVNFYMKLDFIFFSRYGNF